MKKKKKKNSTQKIVNMYRLGKEKLCKFYWKNHQKNQKKNFFAPLPLEIYLQKYKKLANPGLV